ncbi:energy-coupling factor transport system ATP-binding protein [Synechococcus sp. A15-28]|nr:energy-coupling factor transport system ATP-binding protein [Synechococcus sp. A15-28]
MTPETATAELRVTRLSHRWANGQTVLDDCNLVIPGPGLWMLVGSNGSGKSTLFRLIAGLIEPQSGSISTSHRSALVFQNPDHQLLLPSCSSDLILGMDPDIGSSERRERVRRRLEDLGLAGLEHRPIHALSGGQKQRLAIAGALASEASLLLLDEPTALLDPDSQTSVLAAVRELCGRSEAPLTALWITHRLEELACADGAAHMSDGKVGPWMSGTDLQRRLQHGSSDR